MPTGLHQTPAVPARLASVMVLWFVLWLPSLGWTTKPHPSSIRWNWALCVSSSPAAIPDEWPDLPIWTTWDSSSGPTCCHRGRFLPWPHGGDPGTLMAASIQSASTIQPSRHKVVCSCPPRGSSPFRADRTGPRSRMTGRDHAGRCLPLGRALLVPQQHPDGRSTLASPQGRF